MLAFQRRCGRPFDNVGPEFAQPGNVLFQTLGHAETDFGVADVRTLSEVLEAFRSDYRGVMFTFLPDCYGDQRGRKWLVCVETGPTRRYPRKGRSKQALQMEGLMAGMDSREYVALEGGFCPKCRTEAVNVGEFKVTGSSVVVRAHCGHCGASWLEVFALSGFTNLQAKVLN